MSSGQWEVVGKNNKKDKTSQNGKSKSKDDKKTGPKLEDVLSNTQIKSLYSGTEVEGEKKPGKENKKKDGDQKKQPKKQEKKSEPLKPKLPKTLEAALQAIDSSELASIITSNKLRFSNAPLVWLKEVANFLNSKTQVDIEDPTFPNHSPTFPLDVLPSEIKSLLDNILHDAGKANTQLFFDTTLTTLANDMSRGQSVNGHRLLLQMLANVYPEFCVSSIPKGINLRNSYQNRPPIGLSLLWAFGQGGVKDFAVGLQVWQELFLPIIDLRNYSKYIVLYLSKLLDRHTKMASTKLSHEQYLNLLDIINNKRGAVTKEISSDLIKQLAKLKDIYFAKSGNKLQVIFNQLMKKMPNQFVECNNLDPFHRVLVESLVYCIERDDSCNATWRQLFLRCSKPSATLLHYINHNWQEVSKRIKVKSLRITALQYQEVCGEALKGKKKDETVMKANKICQDILDKMTSSRRFPWIWASFFLLLSIGALVGYDVSKAGGSLPKSATGRLLQDLGILEQTQQAWQKTLSTSARGYIWVEKNTPIYYAQVATVSKPYFDLVRDLIVLGARKTGDLYLNMKEYAAVKAPVVHATIEEYAPGLTDSVTDFASKGWESVAKFSLDWVSYTSKLLKEKIFVGQLSPQNIHETTHSALNVTRHHVATYLHWLRNQIHVYSEIP